MQVDKTFKNNEKSESTNFTNCEFLINKISLKIYHINVVWMRKISPSLLCFSTKLKQIYYN